MRAVGAGLGSLGWRLLAAFVAVAVGAVALVTLTAAVSVDRRTAALISDQQAQLRKQVATALAAAYTAGQGSWRQQDLAALQALAQAQGTRIVVWDHSGHEVATMGGEDHNSNHASTPSPAPGATMTDHPTASPSAEHPHPSSPSGASHPDDVATPAPGMTSHDSHEMTGGTDAGAVQAVQAVSGVASALATMPVALTINSSNSAGSNQPVTIPIVVNGATVGTAQITLPAAEQSPVEAVRDALLRTLGFGAALSVLLAVVAAAVVTRRVSAPLVALAAATRSFAAGEPNSGRLLRTAPGELGEVSRAFVDMTAKLAEQDTLRRALLADVAHELRTPVTILRGQTEQLLDGITDPTTERLVSLHDEVLRLERVTEDLATLATADTARLALRPEPVDLGKLTLAIVDAMQPHFDDANLTVLADVADELIVLADSARLSQIVTNLLTNAVKFTPPGGGIKVVVRRMDQQAELDVADTGPGIPADELPHIFDRFWRGRAAGARRGTGIGLAVVQSLVQAHGGTVRARCPAGGGTVFTVVLPTRD